MSAPAAAPAEDPHYLRDVTALGDVLGTVVVSVPFFPYYLRDVTALGDTHEVHTREAVYSKNRIKLLEQGVRVDSALFDQLMQHKLAAPLEQSLRVADAVSGKDLAEEALRLAASDTGYGLLSSASMPLEQLRRALQHAPCDDALAVRLTVMRERRPVMYAHAVGAGLLCALVAVRARMSEKDQALYAGAGLYHDIGEMHVDPELFTARRTLSGAERRHIFVHPMTAYLTLESRPATRGALAKAVLEHHERLDGSGYPRGLTGDKVSLLGKALAVVELATPFAAQAPSSGALERLAMALKLNHRRIEKSASDVLMALAQGGSAQPPGEDSKAEIEAALARLRLVQASYADWAALAAGKGSSGPAFDWATERMAFFERTLVESGLDAGNGGDLAELLEVDPGALREIPSMVRELAWQLTEILHGLHRRPDALPTGALAAWAEQSTAQLAQR